MVKKEIKNISDPQNAATTNDRSLSQQGIFQKGSYLFYPLHLLPKESIETAYAITIHKSQGSGYKAILVLLPDQPGHPLLNRQIAYTAITRTEGATYIYADYDTLEAARSTVIQRDTQIHL
jgi:exodeoxyribonuclease V alpha subunit